jgi:hypothetical protein
LAVLGAGFAACLLLDFFDRDPSDQPLTWVIFVWLLTFLVLGFVTTAVHEAGHLVASWLVGFQFHAVRVGPIHISQQQGNIRLEWIKGAPLSEGFVWTQPHDDRHLRLRQAVVVAGGPAANLLLAGVTIGLIRLFPLEEPPPSPDFSPLNLTWILKYLCLLSIVWAVLSLLPDRRDQQLSDGSRLGILLRGGAEAERYFALTALTRRADSGEPARDWPVHLVEKAIALPDGRPEAIAGLLYAYYWAFALSDLVAARQFLNLALSVTGTAPAAAKAQVFLEAAYFSARFCGDPMAARDFLEQAGTEDQESADVRSRAEAAVRLAEREGEAAVVRAGRMVAAFRRLREEDGA